LAPLSNYGHRLAPPLGQLCIPIHSLCSGLVFRKHGGGRREGQLTPMCFITSKHIGCFAAALKRKNSSDDNHIVATAFSKSQSATCSLGFVFFASAGCASFRFVVFSVDTGIKGVDGFGGDFGGGVTTSGAYNKTLQIESCIEETKAQQPTPESLCASRAPSLPMWQARTGSDPKGPAQPGDLVSVWASRRIVA